MSHSRRERKTALPGGVAVSQPGRESPVWLPLPALTLSVCLWAPCPPSSLSSARPWGLELGWSSVFPERVGGHGHSGGEASCVPRSGVECPWCRGPWVQGHHRRGCSPRALELWGEARLHTLLPGHQQLCGPLRGPGMWGPQRQRRLESGLGAGASRVLPLAEPVNSGEPPLQCVSSSCLLCRGVPAWGLKSLSPLSSAKTPLSLSPCDTFTPGVSEPPRHDLKEKKNVRGKRALLSRRK